MPNIIDYTEDQLAGQKTHHTNHKKNNIAELVLKLPQDDKQLKEHTDACFIQETKFQEQILNLNQNNKNNMLALPILLKQAITCGLLDI
jgi:hypothetical protein